MREYAQQEYNKEIVFLFYFFFHFGIEIYDLPYTACTSHVYI